MYYCDLIRSMGSIFHIFSHNTKSNEKKAKKEKKNKLITLGVDPKPKVIPSSYQSNRRRLLTQSKLHSSCMKSYTLPA